MIKRTHAVLKSQCPDSWCFSSLVNCLLWVIIYAWGQPTFPKYGKSNRRSCRLLISQSIFWGPAKFAVRISIQEKNTTMYLVPITTEHKVHFKRIIFYGNLFHISQKQYFIFPRASSKSLYNNFIIFLKSNFYIAQAAIGESESPL